MLVSTRLVVGLGSAFLAARSSVAQYTLDTNYDTTNFFDGFNFYSGADPTHGYVDYVDNVGANQGALAGYANGGVYMGVDHQTVNPPNGRKSVRMTSQKSFNGGLFIADIAHMPASTCGTWPAFWMFGPGWPASGEIDIIEGVNTQSKNTVTLHTSPGCIMSNVGAVTSSLMEQPDCSSGGGNLGCPQDTDDTQNYGDGFNAAGGGVYAMEWNSEHIAVWFFPRHRIPNNVSGGTPDPSTWGQPTARFAGGSGCDINSRFKAHNIIFDTTFCGDWAGSPDVWGADAECSALAPTCKDYVAANPADFIDAYWIINSVKVYQKPAVSKREIIPSAFKA